MKIMKFFRSNTDGNSAGNESANACRAEYAAGIKRLEEYIFALTLFADPQYFTKGRETEEKFFEFKATAVRILEEVKRVEERVASCKSAYGETTKNAKKVVRITPPIEVQPGNNLVRAVETLSSGRQLIFDLYCSNCYFQCWSCPTCDLTRCACESCGCQLEPERQQSTNA